MNKRTLHNSLKAALSLLFLLAGISIALAADKTNGGETVAYKGKLTRVYVNSEKTPPAETVVSYATVQDGHISIRLPRRKIGKMPGAVGIEANRLRLEPDGTFDQTVANAVKVKIMGTSSYNARVSGRLSAGVLTYTVSTIKARYMLVPIQVTVSFKGKR